MQTTCANNNRCNRLPAAYCRLPPPPHLKKHRRNLAHISNSEFDGGSFCVCSQPIHLSAYHNSEQNFIEGPILPPRAVFHLLGAIKIPIRCKNLHFLSNKYYRICSKCVTCCCHRSTLKKQNLLLSGWRPLLLDPILVCGWPFCNYKCNYKSWSLPKFIAVTLIAIFLRSEGCSRLPVRTRVPLQQSRLQTKPSYHLNGLVGNVESCKLAPCTYA